MEGTIGAIIMFAGSFNPKNWAFCQGQIISIASNTALFSILGTNYGGNGTTTFGLPDLRGRVAIGAGQGPGLSNYVIGEMAGQESVTLLTSEMPAHTHTLQAVTEAGSSATPTSGMFANTGNLDREYAAPGTLTAMHSSAIGATGGGQSHNNVQPVLGMNFIICQYGIFPSRN
jgi:microcystin-dependent protein